MKLHDEIGDLAAAFGSMAADLKNNQDKLLSYGRKLEAIITGLDRAGTKSRSGHWVNEPLS